VTGSGHALGHLLAAAREQFHARAYAIAIAFRSFERDRQPVIVVLRNVVQQRALCTQIDYIRIHFAVVVVVGKACAAGYRLHIEHGARSARNVGEIAVSQAAVERVLLRNQMNQSAVENKNIEPAIVIEVVNPAAPTHILPGLRGDTRSRADVFKSPLAGVAHQAVVPRVGDPQVEQAVAIDVGKHGAHGRRHFAVLSVRYAQVAGNFFEGAVVLIAKQEIFGSVVGNINVGPAVAVKISGDDAHGAALVGAYARRIGHIRERAVAIVVIEAVGGGRVIERSGIVIGSVVGAILGIEFHVTADEKIDAAVAIVVQPRRTDRPSINVDPRLRGDIGECAVAIIVVEDGAAIAGYEQIDEAVVVVIGGDGRH